MLFPRSTLPLRDRADDAVAYRLFPPLLMQPPVDAGRSATVAARKFRPFRVQQPSWMQDLSLDGLFVAALDLGGR